MECFTGFWSQHLAQTSGSPIQPTWIGATSKNKFKTSIIKSKSFQDIILQSSDMIMASEHCSSSDDLREELKNKAEKHRKYYRSLLESSISTNTSTSTSTSASISYKNENKVALDVLTDTLRENTNPDEVELEFEYNKQEYVMEKDKIKRVRRTGVFQIGNVQPEGDDYTFQGVKKLRENYLNLLENSSTKKQEDTQQKSEYDLLQPPAPPSGYCSSTASATSDDEREKEKWSKNNVKRCGSSDSAVGNSDGDEEAIHSNWGETQEIIDDILPYPLIKSPYSPRGSIDHTNVPSKTIIEAKFVPLPVDRKLSDCVSEIECDLGNDSRRPSVFTDDGDEVPRYRYWRTPSVVISDYSDDIMGLTLEDIEFIRNNIAAENNSSADSSLHSSCSNLYCGSTISSLDSEYVLKKPYRKSSDCSTCSTPSDDESEGKHIREPSGWRKLRNIVQWTPFFQTYKKQRYPWIQLAGHQGNFKAGPDQGTILKKLCVKEEKCFKVLMGDSLKPYVPEYKGLVASDDGECSYIQLQDLLGDFVSPCVMDCKIGVRTYLEEELAKAKEKPKLRKDMYEKMCQIDSQAPTDEEHRLKGVTKPRYMVWRETISSTATLGFRIEGIRKADGTSSKDFKTTRSKDDVMNAFIDFTEGFPHAVPKYIQRLKAIKSTLESSQFFNTHEVIGSSLLFVHDRHNANVWLIDFAKTILLPDDVKISHNSKWKVGNHEDGYMIGVNNLISIFKTMLELQPITISPPLALQDPPEMNENILEHTT